MHRVCISLAAIVALLISFDGFIHGHAIQGFAFAIVAMIGIATESVIHHQSTQTKELRRLNETLETIAQQGAQTATDLQTLQLQVANLKPE